MATLVSQTPEYNAPGAALKRALIFFSVTWAGAVFGSTSTIANVVLPNMQGDLSASLDQVSWIVTASVVALAIGTPPSPWIAARFGAKQLMIGSLVCFVLSSAMLGFCSTLTEVVFWRIVQALTGAPIIVLSQTITLATYPMEKRGPVMAIWSIGLTCGWVFAPAIRCVRCASAYLASDLLGALRHSGYPPSFFVRRFCSQDPQTRKSAVRLDRLYRACPLHSPVFRWCSIAVSDQTGSNPRKSYCGPALRCSHLYFSYSSLYDDKKPLLSAGMCFKDRNLSVGILLTFSFAFISLTPLVLLPTMLEQLRGFDTVTVGDDAGTRGRYRTHRLTARSAIYRPL